jgi:hypothetical protein
MVTMTKDRRHFYGEVHSEADLKQAYELIRDDVETAEQWTTLTDLYRSAGRLRTMTRSLAWEEKFGQAEAERLMRVGEDEFARTARKINARAEYVGMDATYDETWIEDR